MPSRGVHRAKAQVYRHKEGLRLADGRLSLDLEYAGFRMGIQSRSIIDCRNHHPCRLLLNHHLYKG